MKKNYFEPEMELIEMQTASMILAGSTGDAIGGGDDGSVTPSTPSVGPTDPSWGKDY